MADPHRNCFYYYRGPSSLQEEARHRQVEDNTTKALINVLEYSEPTVTKAFLSRFADLDVPTDAVAEYYLQGAPRAPVDERRLVAISRLTALSPTAEAEAPIGGSRPDAAIHVPKRALVVFEVKLDLSLDPQQLESHAAGWDIAFPSDMRTVTWLQVYDWAEEQGEAAAEGSITAFLLEQFVDYLELVGLSPFRGIRETDFDFFLSPSVEGQQGVKARLESLWQAVAEQIPEDQREELGEFHVGALALNAPNAWAQTHWEERRINFTVELTGTELWFNVVGWQQARARLLVEWLRGENAPKWLTELTDYELVAHRRRAGNWDRRQRAGARPWWQRETFDERRRYPAPEVSDRIGALTKWIGSLQEPWEKPGFHLRKTWSREAAIQARRDLSGQLAREVSRLAPLLSDISRR